MLSLSCYLTEKLSNYYTRVLTLNDLYSWFQVAEVQTKSDWGREEITGGCRHTIAGSRDGRSNDSDAMGPSFWAHLCCTLSAGFFHSCRRQTRGWHYGHNYQLPDLPS